MTRIARLLAGVALPIMTLTALNVPAFAFSVGKPFVASGSDVLRVQADIGGLQARVEAARAAVEAARASGGDVAGAEAALAAAEAELAAAQSAPAPEAEPAPEPEPEAAPAPEPVPEAPAEPAPAPEPVPVPEPPAAPAPEAPAEPAPAPEAPAAPESAPEAPAAAEPAPAPEAAPAQEAPAEAPTAAEPVPAPEAAPAQPEAPAQETPAEEEAPVPEARPAPEAPSPQAEPAPEAAPEAPAGTPSDTTPADGQPTPDVAPAPAEQGALPQIEAPAMTQEQLDEAKAIAEDPAQSVDTVILPIEKGAAVLDSDKEAEATATRQTRDERRQRREESAPVAPPTSDAEAQAAIAAQGGVTVEIQPLTAERGERIRERPRFERPGGGRFEERQDNRIIIQLGDRRVVRGDDSRRFYDDSDERYYERLSRDRFREVIVRGDGSQVITIRNRYGDVLQRSKIDSRGREYVLYYAPEQDEDYDRYADYRDPGADLPPMRLPIPVRDYIIDTTSDPDRDFYAFLDQPPVERVERVYTLDEVKTSARIRDKVRRIDLDTITFPTGSAEISMNQARSLRRVAEAINKILDENPAETFLIEGHTDAVGSDESNLILSDERAGSVAQVLADAFGIPPENLATQGYGERYLKVNTLGPSQENRRVTIRRVTPLVRPVAANQ